MKKRINRISLVVFTVLVCLSSCGPVHFLTRTKKVPRRYSVNYNYENVKAERSEVNRRAWVVYSDRDGNVATMEPGGALPQQELAFMKPMLVIGKKGDYYKLIKYDPAILKNQRLSKYKQAEFYGWLHKDLLLLYDNALTEIRNGIRLKSLTALTDCATLLEAEAYFSNDSVILYSDPKLENPCGAIALGNIAYIIKTVENGTRVMITPKTVVTPQDEERVIGWVDASLIAPFGQQLALNRSPVVTLSDSLQPCPPRETRSPVSLSPVLYPYRTDSTLLFRTLDAAPLIDHSDNRVYNVNGDPITHARSLEIAARLREINVIFTFIPSEQVIRQLPLLSNAVQNLKPVFEASGNQFNYWYAASVGGKIVPFTSNYLSFSEQVMEAGKQVVPGDSTRFVRGLEEALRLASERPDATNLIVLVGEGGAPSLASLRNIQSGMIRNNCRLLSYQVYAGNEDRYNDFVLQSLDVIEKYAEAARTRKREITVYSDQLRREAFFMEGEKNFYSLDFPAHSMTQGMVIFPEKERLAETGLFSMAVDSLVRQVEQDNLTLITSLERAFFQVGQHRSRFYRNVAAALEIDPDTPVAPYIGNAFREVPPQWVTVTGGVVLPLDSVNLSNVGLLLTEAELESITAFMEKLASRKPDILGDVGADGAGKVRHVRKVRRMLRNVPAGPSLTGAGGGVAGETAPQQVAPLYRPTRPIRRHIRRTYLRALKNCVFEGRPRKLTLSQAQEYITTLPVLTPEPGNVTIRRLRNPWYLSDVELARLVDYFEECKGLIEELAVPVDDITGPAGETYFFLPSQAMPWAGAVYTEK